MSAGANWVRDTFLGLDDLRYWDGFRFVRPDQLPVVAACDMDNAAPWPGIRRAIQSLNRDVAEGYGVEWAEVKRWEKEFLK